MSLSFLVTSEYCGTTSDFFSCKSRRPVNFTLINDDNVTSVIKILLRRVLPHYIISRDTSSKSTTSSIIRVDSLYFHFKK